MGDEMSVWEDSNGNECESMREQWAWQRVMGESRWKTKRVYDSAVMGVISEHLGVAMGLEDRNERESECIGWAQWA